jgi:hypothetical protein
MLFLKKIKQINEDADKQNDVLRLSLDAKNKVKIGEFSRGGKSYAKIKSLDHDFGNEYITPQGLFIPKLDEVKLYFTNSSITANFIVDILTQFWNTNQHRFTNVRKIVLNQDNGPECKSTRTQFIKRICEFSGKNDLTIYLAYYPPYHSKYNPVERVWGILEQHWNGGLLDSVDTVLKYAQSMKWKGKYPEIHFNKNKYQTGIKLDKQTMNAYEKIIERDKELGKWFVEIKPENCKKLIMPNLW